MSSIIRVLVRSVWFLFKWGLLAGVIGLAISVPYLYRRLDSEIRRRIEARFALHYPDLKVTLRSAELVKGEGIQIRGLSILDPAAQGPRAELFRADEAFLTCCVDLDKLICEEPKVARVVVRRPTLRVTRRRDGVWSTARLLPLPKFGPRAPEVVVENGTIEVFDPFKNPPSTLTLRDVNLRLRPADPAERPGLDDDTRHLEASLTGDLLQRVKLEGLLDTYNPRWDISGTIEGLQVSPELREVLPGVLAAKLTPLGPLRGSVKLDFRTIYDPATQPAHRFDARGDLTAGRWDDPRLPHPLTDLCARLHLTHEGFSIQNLSARSGQSTLRLACRAAGYDGQSPMSLTAEIRQLPLDPQLAQVLPGPMRALWDKYGLSGQINADVKLGYDGREWHPEADVECLKISFSYHKFPYRIEYAKGALGLKNDVLTVNLVGYSGSQPIYVSAEVQQPLTTQPYGWFKAVGEKIQLDEKLFAAIPNPSRNVVYSLDPRGSFNGTLWVWRDRPGDPVHRHLVVALNRCWIQYSKFPYPLSISDGTLEMRDNHWLFSRLRATNDTGVITCEGRLTPLADEGRSELLLHFTGSGVPLNEQLRDALRPEMQRFWTSLRPQGMVDLDVDLRYTTGQSTLDVEVRAEPRGDGTSIEPVAFPYRMERLSGVMHYRAGHVDLEQIRAEHGNVLITTAGQVDLDPEGGWRLQLDRLAVDRVRPDRDLMQALPERLKRAIVALNLVHPVNLSGRLSLQRGGRQSDPLTSQWDLNLCFSQASLDFGFKLENVTGGARLVGGFDGQRVRSRGELSIESLQWKNFQFTDVYGPVWIDDEQVLFGSWVDRPRHGPAGLEQAAPGEQPRPMTAQLLSGKVNADAWISLEREPRYRIQANLVQADLGRFSKENMAGQDLSGRIAASVDLYGTGRSLNGLGGNGTIQLRDGDVYELPLMIRLLRLLSIHRPSSNAFSSSDVKFRIEGTHIYLDRIDFSGDAFSLIGQGDMNLQTELHLVFHAQLGRGRLQAPLLQQFLGGASKQLMLVYVDGTLQDPEVTRQPFPGVNHAIQQFQGDLGMTTGQGLFSPPQQVGRLPK